MKLKLSIAFLILFIFIPLSLSAQNLAPIVSNVHSNHNPDNPCLVDVYYDVNDADNMFVSISMQVSSDNGITWDFSCNLITGDVGDGVTNGTEHHIVWVFCTEHPNTEGDYIIQITADDGIEPCPGMPTVVYGDITYHTVQIGSQIGSQFVSQCWLRENLNVGLMIQGAQDQSPGNGIERYCYNNNLTLVNGVITPFDYCAIYGGLYQWAEALQYKNGATNLEHLGTPFNGNVQGICPCGWHIPSFNELNILINIIGGASKGNDLKAVGQGIAPNGIGTNASGFSALLAGWRNSNLTNPSHHNRFEDIGYYAVFWSTASQFDCLIVNPAVQSWAKHLHRASPDMGMLEGLKADGYSVRCLRDEPPIITPETPTLITPPNNAVDISTPLPLSWDPTSGATSYTLQISTVNDFLSFVEYPDLLVASCQVDVLSNSVTYYWRVKAINCIGTSEWSEVWSFTTGLQCPGLPTVFYDSQTYNTVQIGDQCWLKENLNVGTIVNGNAEQTDNSTIEKYCYNNNIDIADNITPLDYCDIYGGLYQWAEAVQYLNGATNTTLTDPPFSGNVQGICPTGWHVPTLAELQTLAIAVNNDGNALKEVGQGLGSGAGTNTSGFSALLSGARWTDGTFNGLSTNSWFLSSIERTATSSETMNLVQSQAMIRFGGGGKVAGFSVRCLKD